MGKDIYLAAIEAILFAAGEPIPIRTISIALNIDYSVTESLLTSLQASYARDGSGLSITVAAGQAQMASSPHVFAYVKAALGLDPPHTLSQAAMETLAIVAYRQPVTRSEIEQIRGVRSSSSLDLLIAKGLVEEYGKLDLPGKPSTFVTSREFLKMMKVAALNDLPEFEDFRSDLSLSD